MESPGFETRVEKQKHQKKRVRLKCEAQWLLALAAFEC
jgi:hypothetical protein